MATNNSVNSSFPSGFTSSGLAVSSTGIATNIKQPAFGYFLANSTANNLTGDGTIVALPVDSMLYDNDNNVTSSTATFTAPVTGIYHLLISCYFANLTATQLAYDIIINTTAHLYVVGTGNPYIASQSALAIFQGSVFAHMTAGDTAIFEAACYNSTKTVGFEGSSGGNAFYGYLVC